jgi:NTP pyrophosphatase (non-canonical NTP hydrolase)
MSNPLDQVLKWQRSEPAFVNANNKSTMLHLMEEVGELCRVSEVPIQDLVIAFQKGFNKDPGDMGKELADIIHMVCAVAYVNDIDPTKETLKCLLLNMKRKWGKPDENGVVNHIKETK